jgi:hypothetical protein
MPENIRSTRRHQITKRRRGAVMQDRNFPGTVSRCLRVFLEILCSEDAETAAEWQVFFPFEQIVIQSQQQSHPVMQSK